MLCLERLALQAQPLRVDAKPVDLAAREEEDVHPWFVLDLCAPPGAQAVFELLAKQKKKILRKACLERLDARAVR